jgi:hypothetical protein
MLKLKVESRGPEVFTRVLENILNLACVACMGGYLPTDRERNEPGRLGLYWYREEHDNSRVQLYGLTNDCWGHIDDETETSCVLWFNFRYDGGRTKSDQLTIFISEWFKDNTELLIA